MKSGQKTLLSSFLAIILLLGFAMPVNPPAGNWYQQFMPNLNGRSISDVFFLDSLTGWAVTNAANNDTGYVLKTTNSGDNWAIQFREQMGGIYAYFRIYFLNQNTGYSCSINGFEKTINGGTNWTMLNSSDTYVDMSILNADTQWVVSSNSLTGGVFYTSNGGANWTQQFTGGNQNPNKIYMFNARIGYMSNNSALPNIYKTTNGGANWSINLANEYFTDMHFIDSLTGWKCMPSFDTDSSVKKTTNGGLNWINQRLPTGGIISTSQIYKFGFINHDTIWGVGGGVYYGGGKYRGVLYRTINSGNNWLFQIPDTSFGINIFSSIQFINKNTGWAYGQWVYGGYSPTGIHTTNGGDTTFLLGVREVSHNIPKEFKLFQNYPNPFNPSTNIRYSVKRQTSLQKDGGQAEVRLIVFDIQGKEIIVLVNQKQNPGIYQVDFSGTNYSSGIYFYSMYIDDRLTETKKMILIK